jgi:putative membrane protein insertion efficiency factor
MTPVRVFSVAQSRYPQCSPFANQAVDNVAPEKTSRARRIVRWIVQFPAHALLLLIRIYQWGLSPALPVIFGSACGCRFSPTCSHYAAEAIGTHGAIVGVVLTAIRLVKCTPLHPGGFDPVPARRAKPRCARVPA